MRVALCQIEVGDDPKENLDRMRGALAAAPDADLAVFPEASQVRFGNELAGFAEPLDGPFVTALREAARAHGTAVIAGVFEPAGGGRVHNTVVGIEADGTLAGSYRKLHLFDAFGDRESEHVAPGDRPVVLDLAGTRIGIVTCYDVRFPELARRLVDDGAQILAVPAAWAQGVFKEEHWTTLVRARAIENTTWVVAVDKAPDASRPPRGAPGGVGRSLLVDPMGAVLADLGPFPGVRVAELDPGVTGRVRERLPSLAHRRRDVL
ncbi:carbon-nitrogen hydrolase family protein [Actinomadura parmotrematis]|uniref:Carbon-nitrogen hydrolase family protein n=1 Tax=Actinomadura parmotrematis TaxID=2864039 RepID=A0ABS7FKU7_9ACTN|nr:carbon-nitrogen hydrolase family protein [Actinomadura parmotrematis]MBW8480981.1 carbon-nitrogen hydrolase family protein [Actinomadura parmotrematis]